MKLLLLEDDPTLIRAITTGLREEGHHVDARSEGEGATEQAELGDYDVIILDWMLPGKDGLSILRELRARGLSTPVLMLTARATVGERVLGLREGADDYLTKPFAFEELLARLEALERRASGTGSPRVLGDVHFDVQRRALVVGTASAALTPREFALAEALFRRLGDVVTRSELLASVWGPSFDGDPNVVDVYVGYLRKKLASVGATRLSIQVVRGTGFRAEVEPT
ncbi:MAG: response regulator transcription factor [Myxococcota bacterium]